jgi:LacI family transcriptional regulator
LSVTIKDVARAASVSVATVSRVLNGHDNVAEPVRSRVLSVVRDLGYSPHQAARSLSIRRTHTVGVVLPDLHGEFFSELVRGIDQVAREVGLHLLVSSYHGHPEEQASALRALRGRVDGLLLMSPHLGDVDFLSRNLDAMPTVLINSQPNASGHVVFGTDNYAGARAMLRHLLDGGYRKVAFIAGPEHNFDAHERLRGYRDALQAFDPALQPWVLPGDFSEASGYRAGQTLLEGIERPDMMALGCLFAFNQAGVRVPDSIAIVGFDDIPIARYVVPSLTTMRVKIAELGARAMRLLLDVQKGDDVAGHLSPMMPELIVRESSRKAAGVPPGGL